MIKIDEAVQPIKLKETISTICNNNYTVLNDISTGDQFSCLKEQYTTIEKLKTENRNLVLEIEHLQKYIKFLESRYCNPIV